MTKDEKSASEKSDSEKSEPTLKTRRQRKDRLKKSVSSSVSEKSK